MGSSIDAVYSAMNIHIQMQDVAAQNLANVSTPGFKRNLALVETAQEGTTPSSAKSRVDFSAGALQATGNGLDFAIQGEGFFTLAGPNGPLYTRAGNFRLNENRMLTTQDGTSVLGDGGEIQVPDASGPVTISATGELRAGETSFGRLKITAFDDPTKLAPAGASTFADLGAGPRDAGDFRVLQGYVEGSNVDGLSELVRMMSTMRDYEACARSLKSIEESASRLYSWAQS